MGILEKENIGICPLDILLFSSWASWLSNFFTLSSSTLLICWIARLRKGHTENLHGRMDVHTRMFTRFRARLWGTQICAGLAVLWSRMSVWHVGYSFSKGRFLAATLLFLKISSSVGETNFAFATCFSKAHHLCILFPQQQRESVNRGRQLNLEA